MKMSCTLPLPVHPAWLIITCLYLAGLLAPIDGYSSTPATLQTENSPNSAGSSGDISAMHATIRDLSPQGHRPGKQKKVLIDDARHLSVFFVIGIAINVIMAATFAWWFSKEWRRSGK